MELSVQLLSEHPEYHSTLNVSWIEWNLGTQSCLFFTTKSSLNSYSFSKFLACSKRGILETAVLLHICLTQVTTQYSLTIHWSHVITLCNAKSLCIVHNRWTLSRNICGERGWVVKEKSNPFIKLRFVQLFSLSLCVIEWPSLTCTKITHM